MRNFLRVLLSIICVASVAGSSPAMAPPRASLSPANIEVELSASPGHYEGACPGVIKFTAKIKSDGPAEVRYKWLRSDGATSAVESVIFTAPGERYIDTRWTLGDPVALPTFSGWQQIQIVSPVMTVSNQATFTLKCGSSNAQPHGKGNEQQPAGSSSGKNIDQSLASQMVGIFKKKPGSNAPQPQPPDCKDLPGGCRPSAAPESARFRITVNGFQVNRRTNDKFLDEDGAKDEVFLRTDAALYDLSTHRNQPSRQSPVIGDSNTRPDRIRAGRATSIGGGNGGFEDGDGFPSSTTPWIRTGAPSETRPPMLAWEGVLTQGGDALALIPTIWESDENPRIASVNWIRSLAETWTRIDGEMQRAIRARSGIRPTDALSNLIAREFDSVRIPNAGNNDLDRPIGMQHRGGEYGFAPQILVFTYDAAERASRDNSSRLGEGVIPVRFKDNGELVGDYTVFLQIEKLAPDGSCPADLESTFSGTASLTTSHDRAPGPFNQDVTIGVRFENCRSTIAITRLDPIVAEFDVDVVGRNRSTLTMIGGGTGAMNLATGRIDIPVQLRLENTQPLGGTSFIDITLSTENPRGIRNSGGRATLTATGRFRQGFLNSSNGTFTVTGAFSPAP